MNKTQLKEKILSLPKFKLKDVRVEKENGEWEDQIHKAVCEVGGDNKALCFVWKNYELLQMKSIFSPVLDSIEGEVEGSIIHWNGYARMKLYPDNEALKSGDTAFGIIAINSVDLSSSVVVKFCVRMGNNHFTVPSKIAGLKKHHSGNVGSVVKNYISMIGPVKEAWKQIVTEFPKYKIVNSLDVVEEGVQALEFNTLIKSVKFGERMTKTMRKHFDYTTIDEKSYTLWDFFQKAIEVVSAKDYKSDVHREKNIDKLCNAIFNYATLLEI